MIRHKLILLMCLTMLQGCKNPIPDPQQHDFIYQELKQELSQTENMISEKKNQIKEFQDKFRGADIQSSERKVIQVKIDHAFNDLRKLEQRLTYWKLKLLSREEIVRHSYLNSFNSGQDWDNSDEIERYKKANARLQKRRPANDKTTSTKGSAKSETPAHSDEGNSGEE